MASIYEFLLRDSTNKRCIVCCKRKDNNQIKKKNPHRIFWVNAYAFGKIFKIEEIFTDKVTNIWEN